MVLATDSILPRIYALKPEESTLQVWMEDDQFAGEGFNLNGIAYDAQSNAIYVVRFNTGTMHRISIGSDGMPSDISQVLLPRPVQGQDGLTALGNDRFLLVEGGGLSENSKSKLLGIDMIPDESTITVLADELNIPTRVFSYSGFAYVVEGQLDHLVSPDAGATTVS